MRSTPSKLLLAACLFGSVLAFAPHLSRRVTESRVQQAAWLERWRSQPSATEELESRQVPGYFFPDESFIESGRSQSGGYFPAGPPSLAWRWRARTSLAWRFLLLKVR